MVHLGHGLPLNRLGQGSFIDGATRMYRMEESSSKENQDNIIFLIIGEGCCPVTNRMSHGDGHSSNSGSERSLWEGRGKSQGSRRGSLNVRSQDGEKTFWCRTFVMMNSGEKIGRGSSSRQTRMEDTSGSSPRTGAI